MPETDWTNDELPTFLTALRATGIFSAGEEGLDHGGFRRQGLRRIVPEIRRRVLAEVGAPVDAFGAAAVALEVVKDTAWDAEHTWLMVTEDPWGYLTDVISAEIRRANRKAVQSEGDAKALKGIEVASSRLGIDAEGMPDGAATAETAHHAIIRSGILAIYEKCRLLCRHMPSVRDRRPVEAQ